MEILIAGKGFIGQALGDKLSKNHDVYYLDRSEADYQFDITKPFAIDDHFDVVFHTIGLAPGFNTSEQYRAVHVEGTRNLVDAVDTDKIVFLSALKAGEVDHSFFRTKAEAEEIVRESGTDYTIVRPSTVFGEGNQLLDLIQKFSVTRIFPNIKTETQPISRGDLVDVLEAVISSENDNIIEAAGLERFSLGQLAERLYAEAGRRCYLVPVPQNFLELAIIALSFLPPPFQRENVEILRHSNTVDENDAERLVALHAL